MAPTSQLVGVQAGVGTVTVGSSGPLGRLMRRFVGLPLRGDAHRAELEVAHTADGGETWIRHFGDPSLHHRSVCSRLLRIDDDTVAERIGAITLDFDVRHQPGGPRMALKAARIWPIRLGRRWLSVDVFVGEPDEGTSHVRARMLGGRLGTLDYSVVMRAAPAAGGPSEVVR